MSWGDLVETVHDLGHVFVSDNNDPICKNQMCEVRRQLGVISTYVYEYRGNYYTNQGGKISCKAHYTESWGYCQHQHLTNKPNQGTNHMAWLISGYVPIYRRLGGNSRIDNIYHGDHDEEDWIEQLENMSAARPEYLLITKLDDEELKESWRHGTRDFSRWERENLINVQRPSMQTYLASLKRDLPKEHPVNCEVCESRDIGELWSPNTRDYLEKGKADLLRSLALT